MDKETIKSEINGIRYMLSKEMKCKIEIGMYVFYNNIQWNSKHLDCSSWGKKDSNIKLRMYWRDVNLDTFNKVLDDIDIESINIYKGNIILCGAFNKGIKEEDIDNRYISLGIRDKYIWDKRNE